MQHYEGQRVSIWPGVIERDGLYGSKIPLSALCWVINTFIPMICRMLVLSFCGQSGLNSDSWVRDSAPKTHNKHTHTYKKKNVTHKLIHRWDTHESGCWPYTKATQMQRNTHKLFIWCKLQSACLHQSHHVKCWHLQPLHASKQNENDKNRNAY